MTTSDLPDVAQRFIRYARIDTQSDPHSSTSPSTAKQLDLARCWCRNWKRWDYRT